MRSSFADRAEEVVYGDREEAYDDPNKNFRNIAKVWSGILGIEISPSQVGLMMVGMKLVRESHKHQDDNIIDAHGYLMCLERILAKEIGRKTSAMAHHVAEQKADLVQRLARVEQAHTNSIAVTEADHVHEPTTFPDLPKDWAQHDRQPPARRRPPVESRDALDMG